MSENIIPAEIEPRSSKAKQAAQALQQLGFRILHIGRTISVQGPQSLWESTFSVTFKSEKKTVLRETEEEVTYQKAAIESLRIPRDLRDLIVNVSFLEPPEMF